MSHQSVVSESAPAPIGPYSQAVRSGKTLYCSGQIALDPASGNLIDGDVSAQAEQVMKNLGAVLEAAGYDYGDVVKTTIFLVEMSDFAAVNAIYGKYFDASKPARSTVAVAGLPRNARVEIDCIARK
ncbi:MAG TPA: RidA family protein [Candidatus Acidoferrum sp.]|jgi:2-iminobutanoate/2-iminopropanoate deaminase|nr:RidA family protein [Candidatus Acidoferrum sp.]